MGNSEEIAGVFCYPAQPANTRIAAKEDFFRDGKLITGRWFLVKSFHSEQFEAYQVKSGFDISKLDPWLNENRVFIKA